MRFVLYIQSTRQFITFITVEFCYFYHRDVLQSGGGGDIYRNKTLRISSELE